MQYSGQFGYIGKIVFRKSKLHPNEILDEVWKHLDGIQLRRLNQQKFQKQTGLEKAAKTQEQDIITSNQNCCIMQVDGARKKRGTRNNAARIGWKATTNACVSFEGNDRIMATSAIHAEAYALLEDSWKRISDKSEK